MDSEWMSEEEYELVTKKTPIPTVDLLILRKNNGKWETLLISRKTGYERGKWCLIGGRQWKKELLEETIARQAQDLGVKVRIFLPFNANFPALVNDNPEQDKTKRCCTHVYPAEIISGQLRKEGEEFLETKWFPLDSLPDKMGYDHHEETLRAFRNFLKFED